MTASGTFGYGREYSEFIDLNKLGAIVVKGLSLQPKEGNPPPVLLRRCRHAQCDRASEYRN